MQIADRAKLARAVGRVGRRRKMPAARAALAVEHELGNSLSAALGRAVARYAPGLGLAVRAVDAGDHEGAMAALERARRAAQVPRAAVDEASTRAAYAAARHHARELGRQLEAALGISVPLEQLRPERLLAHRSAVVGRLNGWLDELHRAATRALLRALEGGDFRADAVAEPDPWERYRCDLEHPIEYAVGNVQQIGGLSVTEKEQLAQALAGLHSTGELSNRRRAEVERFLRERLAMGDQRARFVARDQIARLVGQVNGDRQMALGITHYEWDTRRDRRVRPLHRKRRGKIFAWDSPPHPDGHPGIPVGCRCTARPVVDDIRVILGGRPRAPGTTERPTTYEPPRGTLDWFAPTA